MNSRHDHTPRTGKALTALVLAALSACARGDDRPAVPGSPDSAIVAERPAPVPVMPVQLSALTPRAGATVRRIDVRRDSSSFSTGPAIVTLTSGDTLVVADSAYRVWKLGSSLVAVSGLDGAGGFENEGQSLTAIDVAAGTRRRVVADYFPIVRVESMSAGGRTMLLVHMRDGGQGGLHVTVVDPARGQVFRALHALGRIDGDRILVAGFGDDEQPVVFGETRTPLRVDTLTLARLDTMSLLVVPRSPR